MGTLSEWIAQVCEAIDLPADSVDTVMVLDLARDVAHSVDRRAAPVTAYLAGLAVGRGAEPAQTTATILGLLPD